MTPDYTHINAGRSARTTVLLIAIYFALLAAIIWVDAAWWLMLAIALFTLPALWDLWTNRQAGVELSADELRWFTGTRNTQVSFEEIDHVRFDTRLDLSVRVTVVLSDKKKVRIPYEALPPHRDLEAAMQNHGLATQRHHFSLM